MAPGAVVVTSTRIDLLNPCSPLRARTGPVYVFNAVGLDGIASTVAFDPLIGCTDPNTAAERPTCMVADAPWRCCCTPPCRAASRWSM